MLESLPIPLWRIVVAAVGLFVGIKLIKHILMGGGKTDPYTAASCRCGWKGQVSRYRPACPKCGTRLNLDEVLSQERKPRQETKSRPVVEEQVMSQSRVLTVMFTDIKGFTAFTADSSRAELERLIQRHEEVVLPVLESFRGTLIKRIGDAFLLTFESSTDAVLAGVRLQEVLEQRNLEFPTREQLEVRVAINAGEVTLIKGDVFGDVVNVASRIEGLAEAGEVFFTEAVYLTMNRQEVPSREVGIRRLKGVPEPVRVYKVLRGLQ